MRRFAISFLLAAIGLFAAVAPQACAQAAPKAAASPSQAVLRTWNSVGDKVIAMAEDWSESKYDYRPNDQVRSFQQVLLHIAGANYYMLNRVSGKKLGNNVDDPTGPDYKTKAQTVAFVKKSIADGAAEIQREGDAGVPANLSSWVQFCEHMGEHYGQLVVYYRNNGVVPPSSRPKK